MVQCESCWVLVALPEVPAPSDAPTASADSGILTSSEGVVACRRCGFLSVENAAMRALLQLPQWRDVGGTVGRSAWCLLLVGATQDN